VPSEAAPEPRPAPAHEDQATEEYSPLRAGDSEFTWPERESDEAAKAEATRDDAATPEDDPARESPDERGEAERNGTPLRPVERRR
jgi:hypothetical protein